MCRMTELAAFLRANEDYVVLGHVNPDGDAAGSCIALALALRRMGKRAFVYLPGGLPRMYAGFDCTMQIVSDGELPFEPQTAFAVDVSEPGRLGDGAALFERCKGTALLDHHPTNTGFGDVRFVDGDAAAAGELALELIAEMKVEMDSEMATWLYIAICTDCGCFGYPSTRYQTMLAAAECMKVGIDVDGIHRELYRTRSEGKTRLMGQVLSDLQMDAEKKICWARLTQDMLDRAGALREDCDGIVNYLLEIRGVQFAMIAEERGERTKFSLRSKPPFEIAGEVAQSLGGGGHACAAGVTFDMNMDDALQMVLNRVREALHVRESCM